jgi:hypothetical protein
VETARAAPSGHRSAMSLPQKKLQDLEQILQLDFANSASLSLGL